MDVIAELEKKTQALIASGMSELKEIEAQQQRQTQIAEIAEEIRQRLVPLVEKVETLIGQFAQQAVGNSLTLKQLEQQKETLESQIQLAEVLAEAKIDEKLLQEEERLLAKQDAESLREWRLRVKEELIELIEEQDDFYRATDVAIAVKGYADDLKETGALEEVVNRLVEQINRYDRKASETGSPAAKFRGSYENTLNFIVDVAHRNRQAAIDPPRNEFTSRQVKPSSRTTACEGLGGKVVIVGGHDRLETAVRNRLRQSEVELVWATSQTGPGIWAQVEAQLPGADLIIVLTGYASHKLTEKILGGKGGRTPTYLTTTGMTRLVEAIEVGLKSQQLSQQLGKSRSA